MKKALSYLLLTLLCVLFVSCSLSTSENNDEVFYVVQESDIENTETDDMYVVPRRFYTEEEFINHLKEQSNPVIPPDKYIPLKELFPDYNLEVGKILYYHTKFFVEIKDTDITLEIYYMKEENSLSCKDFLESDIFLPVIFNKICTSISKEYTNIYDVSIDKSFEKIFSIEKIDTHEIINDYIAGEKVSMVYINFPYLIRIGSDREISNGSIDIFKALQNNKTAIPILDNIDKAIAKRNET